MATFKEEKLLGVPYGWWIYLSYEEADAFTNPKATISVATALSTINVWAAAAAASIAAQAVYIRNLNNNSGGKGVRLHFLIPVGVIVSVERLGFGASPVPVALPTSRSFLLSRNIPFTGCSNSSPSTETAAWIRLNEAGLYVGLDMTHSVRVQLPYWYQSTSPSDMRLDWRIIIDNQPVVEVKPVDEKTMGWWPLDLLVTSFPAGNHQFDLEVRSRLVGGPPSPVPISGSMPDTITPDGPYPPNHATITFSL
jgi:hypothetical protein